MADEHRSIFSPIPKPTSADPELIADAIEAFVSRAGPVAIPAILEWGGPAARGDFELVDEVNQLLVLSSGVSQLWGRAISRLIAERRVEVLEVHPLAVIADGGAVALPVGTLANRWRYRSPRWLPVELRVPRGTGAQA